MTQTLPHAPELARVFFAMTELCKGRPASYQPASAAVRGVQEGEFVADLGTPQDG